MKLSSSVRENPASGRKKPRLIYVACLLSAPLIGCAHGDAAIQSPVQHAAVATARPAAIPGDFEKKFTAAKMELAQAGLKLADLRAAKAAIRLKAVISKARRLEERFSISSPAAATGLNAAATDLESGRAESAERAIAGACAELERLQDDFKKTTAAEMDGFLDRLLKIRGKPVFLRRLHAQETKKLAKEAEARLSTLNALDAEKGPILGAADAEAVAYLEKNIAELQGQADALKRQLAGLRGQEIAKAELAVSELVKRLERPGDSADVSSRKAQALFELKAVNSRLDRLRSLSPE